MKEQSKNLRFGANSEPLYREVEYQRWRVQKTMISFSMNLITNPTGMCSEIKQETKAYIQIIYKVFIVFMDLRSLEL